MNGNIHQSFDVDPSVSGWQLGSGTWSNGAIVSSGTVQSDVYHVRSGFAKIQVNNTQTGGGQLQVSIDGGVSWMGLEDDGELVLSQPAYLAIPNDQCNWRGTYTWNDFQVELVRTPIPTGFG